MHGKISEQKEVKTVKVVINLTIDELADNDDDDDIQGLTQGYSSNKFPIVFFAFERNTQTLASVSFQLMELKQIDNTFLYSLSTFYLRYIFN